MINKWSVAEKDALLKFAPLYLEYVLQTDRVNEKYFFCELYYTPSLTILLFFFFSFFVNKIFLFNQFFFYFLETFGSRQDFWILQYQI